MDNDKNINGGAKEGAAGGDVKKKKLTVVFRQQNSKQNSLKSRPGGAPAPKKPQAPKSAGGVKKAEPAGTRSAGQTASGRPAAAVKPAESVKAAEPVKVAEAVKPVETVKAEAAAVKATEAAAVKTAEAAKPAEAVKPAEPAKSLEPAKPAEPAAPEKPAEPVRRFVDMSQVRAVEKQDRDRAERLNRQQKEREQARRQNQGRPQGDRPFNRQGDRPQGDRPFNRQGDRPQGDRPFSRQGDRPFNRQGDRPQGDRPFNRQGDRPFGRPGDRPLRPQGAADRGPSPFDKDKDDDRSARRPQTDRKSQGPKSDFGGMGLSKPQGKNTKQGPKDNNKYNKNNDHEEMKRPGGKNAKGGKGFKDLEKAVRGGKESESKEPAIKMITIPEVLTIKELADHMKLQPSVIIKKLFMSGKIVTVNQEIDYDTAADIALEFDVLAEKEVQVDVLEELLKETIQDAEEDLVARPPVVCVMGHVDHGKTSLLDAIRETNVTAREAGGITQHIGAYMVEINGQQITFLDTPGHEAFTAMRMRGAKSTDIAILVVAADDGVMPQTVEAINHAKAAGVEIIVAINKIDKPGANIEKVKQELTEYGLVGEEWGGSNIFVPVSAKRGDGISDLLEMVLLVAEVHELKANPNRKARGLVIEAQLDKGKGPVATVLVQKGTLRVGDTVAAGASYGKVRAMMDDKGQRVMQAGPSMPVEILGLNDVPAAGEVFLATPTEKEARSYAETFIAEGKKRLLDDTKTKLTLDDLFSQIKAGNVKELNLIVKADVAGSVEAVKQSLLKLSNDEIVVKVIHSGAGNITESDVTLASASNAIIIGFNVKPDATAKSIAEREKVDVRLYDVIYKALEDVEAAMVGMLDPIYEEQIVAHAVVRQIFKASGVGNIAGSYVLDGKLVRGCKCRIKRGKDQIFDGALASLKRFKDDVKEVAAGYECGLVFEKFNEIQVDDEIEAYVMVEVPRQKISK